MRIDTRILIATLAVQLLFVGTSFAQSGRRCIDVFRFSQPTNVYRVDEHGNSVGVKRIETLAGRAVEVIDVTGTVKERQAPSDTTTNIFNVSDVFADDVTFLGFGKPNVYIATSMVAPNGKVRPVKFAAKSLKRADSEVQPTGGRVQSGVLIVFRNLPPSAQERIFEAAKKHEGTRRWTCVNANCRVLSDAGFSMSGSSDLENYYFPTPLLTDILNKGLHYGGHRVKFDVVRTTPDYLEDVGLSIEQAVAATPVRHGVRAFGPLLQKIKKNVFLIRVRSAVTDTFGLFAAELPQAEPEFRAPLESSQVRLANNESLRAYDVDVSEPSKLGTLLRLLWGPHALFQFPADTADVQALLPTNLRAFPHENPSTLTKIKKHFIFSKPVVSLIRSQLAARSRRFEKLSEKDLFDMLRTDSFETPNRYNVVITENSITIMKIGIKVKFVDWVLSKHVLVSGYSNSVRFAGEIWKSEDGVLHINGNSGTYTPTASQVTQAGELVRKQFPNIPVEVHLH